MTLQENLSNYSELLFFTEKIFTLKIKMNANLAFLLPFILAYTIGVFHWSSYLFTIPTIVFLVFAGRVIYFGKQRNNIRELIKNCVHITSAECFDAMFELVQRKYLGIEKCK